VVVTVHADDPARMAELASVLVIQPTGEYREVALQGFKRLGGRAVIKLAGYDSPEEARSLVGKELFISAQASTPAPAGRYYAYQLLGMVARLKDGTAVGEVKEVLRQGAQTLLVIQSTSEAEVLVPLVRSICVRIDVEGRAVTLDPPEGLLTLNRRGR